MKKITLFIGFIVVILSLITTGCIDIFTAEDKTIIYESHPTSILYTLSYGYKINCTGSGDYELLFNCDEPSILSGSVISI